jgi:hypothetical protein
MNYQYRFGFSFTVATQKLYADGGFGRYYSGIGAALIQGEQQSYLPEQTSSLYVIGQCLMFNCLQDPWQDLETQRPTLASWHFCSPTLT